MFSTEVDTSEQVTAVWLAQACDLCGWGLAPFGALGSGFGSAAVTSLNGQSIKCTEKDFSGPGQMALQGLMGF